MRKIFLIISLFLCQQLQAQISYRWIAVDTLFSRTPANPVTIKDTLNVLGRGYFSAGGSSGSGINTVLRISGGFLSTVNDATQFLIVQRNLSNDYGAALRLVNTNSSPNFLNPRLDFLVQRTNTNVLADMGVMMTILGSGNVGIGTTSPNYKLDVNGTFGVSGLATLNNLYAEEMHVKNFIADLEQAIVGGQIICKSVAVLYQNFTVGDTLVVEEISGYTGQVFANNDYILMQNFSRGNFLLTSTKMWGTVTYISRDAVTKTQKYLFTKLSGAATTATVGSLVLDYGTSGDGTVEQVAVGVDGAKPYVQTATWTTAPYTDLTVRARLGWLGSNGHGFWGEAGGIGNIMSDPLLVFDDAGLYVKNTGSVKNVFGDGTYLGNWQSTAGFDGTILNHSGLYGYSNNTLVFKIASDGAVAGGMNVLNDKMTMGTASKGIALNLSSTNFVTDKGFEVYDTSNIKLFVGDKSGSSMDYNVTTANQLTLRGNIKSFATITGGSLETDVNGDGVSIKASNGYLDFLFYETGQPVNNWGYIGAASALTGEGNLAFVVDDGFLQLSASKGTYTNTLIASDSLKVGGGRITKIIHYTDVTSIGYEIVGGANTRTVSISGATEGDRVIVTPSYSTSTHFEKVTWTGVVSASNEVKIFIYNNQSTAISYQGENIYITLIRP